MHIGVRQLPALFIFTKFATTKKNNINSNKKSKQENRGGNKPHRRRLGVNNVDTGLLSNESFLPSSARLISDFLSRKSFIVFSLVIILFILDFQLKGLSKVVDYFCHK